MIPVLYESTETDFTTFGIGALSDVTSCIVTEERNGQYECLLTYPITGAHYSDIQAERIIKTKAHQAGDDQLFRIYRISKPLRGIVTVYAQHISYDLSGVSVTPFTGSYTPAAALDHVLTGTGFTGHTNKSGAKTFAAEIPKSARALLGGTEGSILDLWGGEYKFDNHDVYLYVERGLDRQVVIEYGKNLTELVADHNLADVYSELLPYATYMDDSGSHTVTGDAIPITSVLTRSKTLIKDFTFEFEGEVTKAQLNAAAAAWLANNPLGYETPSLTVSFTPESVIPARIDLCDTVTIRYTALGVDVKAKVVKTEYDSLLERYTRLTVGKPRANMADTVAALTDQARVTADYPSLWKSAIATATEMITGNTGGNVVLHTGPDGKPYELLVMDNADISLVQKIWRWTLGGLGYSTNGYDGPYELAITADGRINADFIRTGRLIISDAADNTLFDADINTNRVYIAGFTVTDNGLDYSVTEPSGTGVLAGHTNTAVIHVGTDGVERSVDAWEVFTDDSDDPPVDVAGQVKYSEILGGDNTANTGIHAHYEVVEGDGLGYPTYTADSYLRAESLQFNYDMPGEVTTQNLVNADGMITQMNNAIGRYGTRIYLSSGNYTKIIDASGPTAEFGSGTTPIASGSYKTLGSIDFPRGTYLIMVNARFPSNATGRREVLLSTSQNSGSAPTEFYLDYRNAVNGNYTNCKFTAYRSFSAASTTMYINAYQNSGGNQSVFYRWSYVRLA